MPNVYMYCGVEVYARFRDTVNMSDAQDIVMKEFNQKIENITIQGTNRGPYDPIKVQMAAFKHLRAFLFVTRSLSYTKDECRNFLKNYWWPSHAVDDDNPEKSRLQAFLDFLWDMAGDTQQWKHFQPPFDKLGFRLMPMTLLDKDAWYLWFDSEDPLPWFDAKQDAKDQQKEEEEKKKKLEMWKRPKDFIVLDLD